MNKQMNTILQWLKSLKTTPKPKLLKRIKDDKLERKTMEACSICGLHLKQEDNHNDLTCKTCDGFPMI